RSSVPGSPPSTGRRWGGATTWSRGMCRTRGRWTSWWRQRRGSGSCSGPSRSRGGAGCWTWSCHHPLKGDVPRAAST
ncbi:unnamed protein product, partial [Musa textilis]